MPNNINKYASILSYTQPSYTLVLYVFSMPEHIKVTLILSVESCDSGTIETTLFDCYNFKS